MNQLILKHLKGVTQRIRKRSNKFEVLAYALYPKVFLEYRKAVEHYGDLSVLDTPTYFYGLRLGEEIEIEIEKGKTLIVKLLRLVNRELMEQELFTLN